MKQFLLSFLSTVALLACFAPSAHAQVLTKKTISLELAKKIAAAAEAEAVKNKWTMVIVIVDDGGNLIYLEKIDNTQLGSIEIAERKAKTALNFKRPTKAFEDSVLNDKRNVVLAIPGIMAIEGGLPLVLDGVPIGAIGVSGMKPAEDGIVAKAGADAFAAAVQTPAP